MQFIVTAEEGKRKILQCGEKQIHAKDVNENLSLAGEGLHEGISTHQQGSNQSQHNLKPSIRGVMYDTDCRSLQFRGQQQIKSKVSKEREDDSKSMRCCKLAELDRTVEASDHNEEHRIRPESDYRRQQE